jgi:hypothetical protein
MENFRFILEPYNRHQRNRYTCPSCGKHREFTRYIDTQGAISFPEYVGKCNRINNCGYHYTPAMYFDEHPECKEYKSSFPIVKDKKPVVCHPKLPPVRRHTDTSFIPDEIMQQTMKCYEQNNLFLYLANHLGYESALRLMKTYHVGTARKWKNATVFWQTDISGKIRTGKIMQYNAETGKRIKEPYAHVSWVHTELDIPEFHLQQCYFGEHLLYNSRKPVAIVESEKTAIIASFYIPEYIWLATGGKNGCFNEQNFGVLKGRNIVLFPDIGMTQEWKEKCMQMRKRNIRTEISEYLEENANDVERVNGYDIADYLIKVKSGEAVLQSMTRKNPALKLLIETFDLELSCFGTQ